MTDASAGIDDLGLTPNKATTTVAMDFGRLSLDKDLILYLFGTPGQHRFWFMWDDLVRGAIGAVVLIDTRRLADGFPAIDYFEEAKLPFVVGVNGWDGQFPHSRTRCGRRWRWPRTFPSCAPTPATATPSRARSSPWWSTSCESARPMARRSRETRETGAPAEAAVRGCSPA